MQTRVFGRQIGRVAQSIDMPASDAAEQFEALFYRHYEHIVNLLYRLLGSREEAEEQAQETFLRLARNAAVGWPDEEAVAWLRRVALNLGYNVLRSRQREMERLRRSARLEEPLNAGLSADDPEVVALRGENIIRVRRALAGISECYQACLILRYSGLSYKEIAAAIGVAPGSIGTLLVRAEEAFRGRYEADS